MLEAPYESPEPKTFNPYYSDDFVPINLQSDNFLPKINDQSVVILDEGRNLTEKNPSFKEVMSQPFKAAMPLILP